MTHELRKLAEAATQGDWKQHLVDDTTVVCNGQTICCTFPEGGLDDDVDFDTDTTQREYDAAYIAAANPKTVLALLDRIAELEGALKPFAEAKHEYPEEEADDTAWGVIVDVRDLRRVLELAKP